VNARILHAGWPADRRGRATVLAAAAAGLALAGLAGCGSGGAPASAPAGPAGPSASGWCTARHVTVSLDPASAGVTAGSTFYPIDFTNTSGASCRLTGYPAAWLEGSAGHRIGAAAARDRAVTPHRIRLQPGATAHAWLQVAAAANLPPGQCHQVTAHWLTVRLPGGSGQQAEVPVALPTCSSARAGRILTVQPIVAGRGRRGTAQ
jgi:hypothetical protein